MTSSFPFALAAPNRAAPPDSAPGARSPTAAFDGGDSFEACCARASRAARPRDDGSARSSAGPNQEPAKNTDAAASSDKAKPSGARDETTPGRRVDDPADDAPAKRDREAADEAVAAASSARPPIEAVAPVAVSTTLIQAQPAPPAAATAPASRPPSSAPETPGSAPAELPAAASLANRKAASDTSQVAANAQAASAPEPAAQAAKNSARAAKSAADKQGGEGALSTGKEKIFLTTDDKSLAHAKAPAGTAVAEQGEAMQLASQTRPRFLGSATSIAEGAGRPSSEDESTFVAWKGWTNGGGERASTAAQFSKLAEQAPANPASLFVTPGFGPGRPGAAAPATFVAPAAPAAATPEPEVMAPVNAAIERMISRGQDHLALTVRFENGGSLSLRLTMREGEIASQFQTDVPGLENALRNSWGQFAQDSQHKGWKLAAPTFSAGTSQQEQQGQREGRPADQQAFPFEPGSARAAPPSPATVADSQHTASVSTADRSRGWTIWA